jgi:hypothetical protein
VTVRPAGRARVRPGLLHADSSDTDRTRNRSDKVPAPTSVARDDLLLAGGSWLDRPPSWAGNVGDRCACRQHPAGEQRPTRSPADSRYSARTPNSEATTGPIARMQFADHRKMLSGKVAIRAQAFNAGSGSARSAARPPGFIFRSDSCSNESLALRIAVARLGPAEAGRLDSTCASRTSWVRLTTPRRGEEPPGVVLRRARLGAPPAESRGVVAALWATKPGAAECRTGWPASRWGS